MNIANPSYPDPYQGRTPASVVRARAEHQHRRRQHGESVLRHVQRRLLAPARRGHGDQRGRRLHEVERVQRERDDQQPRQSAPGVAATPLGAAEPRMGQHLAGAVDWLAEVTRRCSSASRSGCRTATSTRRSYTLGKVTDNSFGGTSTGTITDYYNQQLGRRLRQRRPAARRGLQRRLSGKGRRRAWHRLDAPQFGAVQREGRQGSEQRRRDDRLRAWHGQGRGQPRQLGPDAGGERLPRIERARPDHADVHNNNNYNRFDVRASKAINLSSNRRLELIAQVFNLFGRNNLGGIGSSFQTNALSNTFGQISTAQPRQQGEIAVRMTF